MTQAVPRQISYGDHPDQVGDHYLPSNDGPSPLVVLVHGGFWKWGPDRDRTLMTPLAVDLAERGFAVWNIEYRRVGQDGGGWPGTLEDVARALDAVAEMDGVDPARVATVGHSAGGHLALWLAARHRIPSGQPGFSPRVLPCAAVSQAGVADLVRGSEDALGSGACAAFLGGMPAEVPERYAVASPAALLPLGVPQLLVHGGRDTDVPIAQSRSYAAAAQLDGDSVEIVVDDDADHFDVIDPAHRLWAAACRWLERALGP